MNQLLQSVTPEPAFTADDFRKAIVNGSLLPKDPDLGLRMTGRLGVNFNVAQALSELGSLGLIDDPNAIPPLIQCLNHPWLEVSRRCENTLVTITRHSYGWKFYYDQPPPPTEEGRQRFVADWREWERQMKSAHPIFDEWLASECLQTAQQIGQGLTGVLKGIAANYINNFQNARLRNYGGVFSESIFEFGVGHGLAANWGGGNSVDWVGVRIFRPGVLNPGGMSPKYRPISSDFSVRDTASPESLYRESFSALDLEVDVEVDTRDEALRNASFLAVKKALDELRDANKNAAASN